MTWMPEFRHLYIPSYMNAGSYFIGIVVGFMVPHYRGKVLDARTKRFLSYMFWLVPILGMANIELSNIFYFFEFEKPALWISLFSIVSRIIWGFLGVSLVLAALFKTSKFCSKIVNADIFQPLGRVTYCIYVVHLPLMRVFGGGNKGVVHLSFSFLVSFDTLLLQNRY